VETTFLPPLPCCTYRDRVLWAVRYAFVGGREEVSFPHSYNYSTRMLRETEVKIERNREKERRPAMSFSEI
jgi:hypothetical protein